MTNNAPVFWEVQTTTGAWFSLNTYAWSAKSFGGRRWFAGSKRGEDLQLPHRRGRMWIAKTREAQTYDINMWVLPINEDGTRDANKTIEQKSHENWRKIIAAVDQETQFRIRKRWHTSASVRADFGTQTHVQSAIGLAEFIDGSGPDADDGSGFEMNLTFSLADPYFYSNVVTGYGAGEYTPAMKAATATTLSNNAVQVVPIVGEAPTDHLWISMSNMGASNPRIVFPDGNWVQFLSQYSGDGSSEVIIDCRNGLAIRKSLSAYLGGDYNGTYLNGLIRRNPYFQNWPTLDPAKFPSSPITVTGSGTIKLVYDPAYR